MIVPLPLVLNLDATGPPPTPLVAAGLFSSPIAPYSPAFGQGGGSTPVAGATSFGRGYSSLPITPTR